MLYKCNSTPVRNIIIYSEQIFVINYRKLATAILEILIKLIIST